MSARSRAHPWFGRTQEELDAEYRSLDPYSMGYRQASVDVGEELTNSIVFNPDAPGPAVHIRFTEVSGWSYKLTAAAGGFRLEEEFFERGGPTIRRAGFIVAKEI